MKGNFKSVGLVIEPNFFTLHYYGDREGQEYRGVEDHQLENHGILSFDHEMNPLYAVFSNPHWTLVPRAIFREGDARRYLQLNTGAGKEAAIGFEEIPRIDATLVFEPSAAAENTAKIIHPALSVKPLIVPLLNYADILSDNGFDDFILIRFSDGIAHLIAYSDKSLLLANALQVEKKEDLEYYVLFLLNKLKLSRNVALFISEKDGKPTGILKGQLSRISKPPLLSEYTSQKADGLSDDLIPLISPKCA